MKFSYYPGCALERNALAYHQSLMAIAPFLGMELEEVEDWNCCGATEFFTVDKMAAYALSGRNLAIAASQSKNGNTTMAVPCSACFLNLRKTDHSMGKHPEMSEKINQALSVGDLSYTPGSVKVRHLLQAIMEDIGPDAIMEKITRPLHGLRLAPYYGCMVTRPIFDLSAEDPEYPTSLDILVEKLGAEVVDFPVKTHCCGGHMTQISEPTALELIRRLLKNAADYEADAIVTLCPMCQLNLDAYQHSVNKYFKTNFSIPVLYFTQVVGLAFGLKPRKELGFGSEFITAKPLLKKIKAKPIVKSKNKRPPKEALPMPKMPEVK